MSEESWSQWVRRRVDETWNFFVDHFAILLLFWWTVGMLLYVLHIAHHAPDKDLLSWGREVTAGVIGALLGILTGAKIGEEKQKNKEIKEAKEK